MNEESWKAIWSCDASYYQAGSYRSISPSQTLAWINQFREPIGITRLAEVTRLDVMGIPVWQAIRPCSRNLTVSQGKGVSDDDAKVSALMESIEMFHAESPPCDVVATTRELRAFLRYEIGRLPGRVVDRWPDSLPIEWSRGRFLDNGEPTLVPRDLITLDFTRKQMGWAILIPTSNGLASGNNVAEAVLHSLYEVIERDAIAATRRTGEYKAIDPHQFSLPELQAVVRRGRVAGLHLFVEDHTGKAGIPCIVARLHSSDRWTTFTGSGCNFAPEIATLRAITEAAQSRLTAITGSRDDISELDYYWNGHLSLTEDAFSNQRNTSEQKGGYFTEPLAFTNASQEIAAVLEALSKAGGYRPIVVELTKPEYGVPVVFTIIPGFKGPFQ